MVAHATPARPIVERITANLVAERTEHLPPRERDALRWLQSFYWDEGLSCADLGRKLVTEARPEGYHSSTISRAMRAEFEGDRTELVEAIEAFRDKLTLTTDSVETPWVKTALTEELSDLVELARTLRRLICVYGESQIGKSKNLREIAKADRNGFTHFVEIWPSANKGDFITALCAAIRLGSRLRPAEVLLNIVRYFLKRPGSVLIVDEGARAGGERGYGGGSFEVTEFIRWLQENAKIGVVFCGTNVTRDNLSAAKHAKFLNQWNRRVLVTKQLPDIPSRADLNAFAAHYGLPPASGAAYAAQKTTIASHGLGVWLSYYQLGARAAKKKGKPMTWDHVLNAYAYIQDMGKVEHQHRNKEAA